jgi:hypothetical protein
MDSQASNLKAHLQHLHQGLAGAGPVDAELRSLLTQLDADIRALLEQREAAAMDANEIEGSHTYGMAERTQELAARFAAQHPRLEPTLRELANMLSTMGI